MSTNPFPYLNRREWLAAGIAGCLAPLRPVRSEAATDPVEDTGALIIRSARPLDAETPAGAFLDYATPNDRFFVRSHFGAPAVGLHEWTIEVGGGIRTPAAFRLDEIRERFSTVRRAAVLQCAGNGRAYFRPRIPGVAWERGAVGNAVWEGVRLADVLAACGLADGIAHVHFEGSDGPPLPKTPPWVRSLPIDRALDPGTLIAFRMNDQPLPRLHGGPARLVVPGWTGNHWMKWLRRITPSESEAGGFYQQTGYRLPERPVPPGVPVKPEDLRPVTWMNVKSLLAAPIGRIAPGPTEIRGVAWTGRGRIARVEVEVAGRWREAELHGPDEEGSWRLWRLPWRAEPGEHLLRCRATDTRGETQPEAPPWNRSGYLWNGFDRRTIEVTEDA